MPLRMKTLKKVGPLYFAYALADYVSVPSFIEDVKSKHPQLVLRKNAGSTVTVSHMHHSGKEHIYADTTLLVREEDGEFRIADTFFMREYAVQVKKNGKDLIKVQHSDVYRGVIFSEEKRPKIVEHLRTFPHTYIHSGRHWVKVKLNGYDEFTIKKGDFINFTHPDHDYVVIPSELVEKDYR